MVSVLAEVLTLKCMRGGLGPVKARAIRNVFFGRASPETLNRRVLSRSAPECLTLQVLGSSSIMSIICEFSNEFSAIWVGGVITKTIGEMLRTAQTSVVRATEHQDFKPNLLENGRTLFANLKLLISAAQLRPYYSYVPCGSTLLNTLSEFFFKVQDALEDVYRPGGNEPWPDDDGHRQLIDMGLLLHDHIIHILRYVLLPDDNSPLYGEVGGAGILVGNIT